MPATPLRAAHEALGARFTDFGGWEMPLRYRGVIAEHTAVRNGVGVFDVSHLGRFEVTGGGRHRVAPQPPVQRHRQGRSRPRPVHDGAEPMAGGVRR